MRLQVGLSTFPLYLLLLLLTTILIIHNSCAALVHPDMSSSGSSSNSALRQRRNVIAAAATSNDEQPSISTNKQQQPQQPRVLVVGGGLAGAAVAKFMADQKQDDNDNGVATPLYQVHLCEAYPHPESSNNMDDSTSTNRYVISLGKKGQDGLRKATGIDPSTDIVGSVYSDEVARMPSGKVLKRAMPSLIVPRQRFAGHLLQEAQASGVTVHFEHVLVDVDFNKRVATFEIGKNKKQHDMQQKNNPLQVLETKKEIAYDLLIGADGARSRVRTLLDQTAVSDFSILKMEEDTMEYQVCLLPNYKPEFENITPKTMFTWNDPTQNAVCLCYPLADSTTSNGNTPADIGRMFVPIFPQGKLGEFQKQYADSQGKHGYTEALISLLPNIPESTRQEIAVELSKGKQANGGLCVWTSSLGSPTLGVALVGDAGHGMWPSLGQGANCALESAGVFCDVVHDERCRAAATTSFSPLRQWSADIVQEYNARRFQDAQSAVDLTYGGIGGRKARGQGNAPSSYKLQMGGMMLLHVLTCKLVPKPALLRLMSADDVSYVTAKNMHFYYERWICLGVFVGVPAVTMAAIAFLYLRQ